MPTTNKKKTGVRFVDDVGIRSSTRTFRPSTKKKDRRIPKVDAEPATKSRGLEGRVVGVTASAPNVELTLHAGPGLRVEISASYETAFAALQWLQGQVLPTFIDTSDGMGTPRWLVCGERDEMLVHLDLEAPGIDINVRAHQDIAMAVVGALREFLKPHRAAAPPAPAKPASTTPPPRSDCSICATRDADPKWSPMRGLPCTHSMPMPPQGVRIEDDPQGNPRIVKNEPTNG
jgi:hypothetical protein